MLVRPLTLTPRLVTDSGLSDLQRFSCGDEDYQQEVAHFLRHGAIDRARNRYSSTYVFAGECGRTLGFVTLACSAVPSWTYDPDLPDLIPVLLIEYLGVDCDSQNRGVGRQILAFVRHKAATLGVGCRFIALYCNQRNDRALDFYRRHGFFQPEVNANEDGEVLLLQDLAAGYESLTLPHDKEGGAGKDRFLR